MRTMFFTLFFLAACGNANAAFTCEQIKEKATRAACVEERTAKEKQAITDAQVKAAIEEKEKAAKAEKSKEVDDFVQKSKEALVRNYRDPSAAQFTNLVISQTSTGKYLCGSVNGKNAYGAYIGASKFSVTWSNEKTPRIWTEGETREKLRGLGGGNDDPIAKSIEKMELDSYRWSCLEREGNIITKVEKTTP